MQRYRCTRCGKTASENQPLNGVRIEEDKAAQIVKLLCEGLGVRGISRLLNVHQQTVLNVLQAAGEHCEKLLDAKINAVPVEHVQIDELFGFVGCLQQNTTVDDLERGDQYVFLAIDRNTKLVLHHHVGKRDTANAREFLYGLKPKVSGHFQLTSDGFAAYCGHIGAVWHVFRDSIDYATEIKHYAASGRGGPRRYNPVICQWVKRQARIGNPDLSKATTNHCERLNLSFRLFNRRFTRRTINYSKTLENHRYATAVMLAHFNFCRVHSAHKKTPAIAACLTDHQWTVEELLLATI